MAEATFRAWLGAQAAAFMPSADGLLGRIAIRRCHFARKFTAISPVIYTAPATIDGMTNFTTLPIIGAAEEPF